MYTGKGMGYMRIPDWQSTAADGRGCKDPQRQKAKSDGAIQFEEVFAKHLPKDSDKSVVLLGAGDNFAPEIEARDFCDPPAGQKGADNAYQRVGKELFDWDAPTRQWIRSDQHTTANEAPANGIFMIPMDNIANFFVQEGYAAVVPGKQDFYFGPERMREFGRFMASVPIPSTIHTLHNEGDGTQMLGANIVIQTTWKKSHAPLPENENAPWFIPRFPTARDLLGAAAGPDADLQMSGLGANVYPWFRGVTVQMSGGTSANALQAAVDAATFFLCPAKPGLPKGVPQPVNTSVCTTLPKIAGKRAGQFVLDFPWADQRHFYTLMPGANYAICAVAPKAAVKAEDGSGTFCSTFTVYTPFFQSSGDLSGKHCADLTKPECYRDPDPYVWLETKGEDGVPEDLAIFGAVDPTLGANVGMMNLAWSNTEDAYKSTTSILDPGESLRQMLDCLDRRLDEEGYTEQIANGSRRLIKVLLAQMTTQEAEILGTRLKEFQVVVSAADQELATVGDTVTSQWSNALGTSSRHPMVLAVPEPYFVGSRGQVDIGQLDVEFIEGRRPRWTLVSKHDVPEDSPAKTDPKPAGTNFWKAVEDALRRDCVDGAPLPANQTQQIEYLTLCEMQKKTGANVAMLQERDFFAQLPGDAGDIPDKLGNQPENALQQLLDRIVWKGDFLSLLYVPGSALQNAMKESKSFDASDRSELSVGNHKQRGLLSIGIMYDAAHGEYLVNGLRLDPKKLYLVAASDFIGGGDTGYPELFASQMRPPTVPDDYDSQLVTISDVVCSGIAGETAASHCLGAINRDSYLDQLSFVPSDIGPSRTNATNLLLWSGLFRGHHVPGDPIRAEAKPETLQQRMDQFVEYRKTWDLNLSTLSFGVTTLGHNGTDAQIDQNFSGITTPGVNSHRFTNWTSNFQATLTRNWRRYQWFATPAYNFNVQYKGQSTGSRQVNQVANLGMFDTGFARLWSERGSEHKDLIVTAHYETPLEQTYATFTLKSTPPATLQFNEPRSNTLLLRAGFRLQHRISSIEFGPEGGRQFGAVNGLQFFNKGALSATCLALSDQSFTTCVGNDSNPKVTSPPTIVPTSAVSTLQGNRDHAGMYWKINVTVPIHPRIAYVFNDQGDYFFTRFGTENTTDTLFRDIEQHQLRFIIFPSFSIGPELDLLLYQNKTIGTLQGSFLRQDQIVMKAQVGFDLFNRRKRMNQIEYAPGAGGSQ